MINDFGVSLIQGSPNLEESQLLCAGDCETEKLILKTYLSSAGYDDLTFEDRKRISDKQSFEIALEEILNQYEVLFAEGLINPGNMAINYITGDQQVPYIASGGYPFHSLYNNPQFLAIRGKMKLPLPKIK